MKEQLRQMENVKKKENEKPKFSLGGLRYNLLNKNLLKGAAFSLALFFGNKSEGKNLEINKNDNTEASFGKDSKQNKSEVGFVGFDDFGEAVDSVKTPGEKYPYKLLGQKKMVGEMRNYYGVDKNIKADEPYNIQKTREELNKIGTKKLGELYVMGAGKMLFYNFGLDGRAHVVELDENVEVFFEDGRIYAVVCGNLLKPVLGIDYGDEAQKTTKANTKIITREDLEKANLVGAGDGKSADKKENKEQKVYLYLQYNEYRFDGFENNLYYLKSYPALDVNGEPVKEEVSLSEVGKRVNKETFFNAAGVEEQFISSPKPRDKTDSYYKAQVAKFKNLPRTKHGNVVTRVWVQR